jgi:hypothetical protein
MSVRRPGVDCLSGDWLADASLGSGVRLRCAALTAFWSFAMSFSPRGGGVASSVIGQPSLGRPSFARFDMSSSLHGGAREKCQLMSMCTRWLLSMFNVVGMHSTERRGLCCVRSSRVRCRATRLTIGAAADSISSTRCMTSTLGESRKTGKSANFPSCSRTLPHRRRLQNLLHIHG